MTHDEAVRLAVYRGYVNDGRPPSVEEMAVELALSADAVREALQHLHDARHLVLRDGEIGCPIPSRASRWASASWASTRCGGAAVPGRVRDPGALPGRSGGPRGHPVPACG